MDPQPEALLLFNNTNRPTTHDAAMQMNADKGPKDDDDLLSVLYTAVYIYIYSRYT